MFKTRPFRSAFVMSSMRLRSGPGRISDAEDVRSRPVPTSLSLPHEYFHVYPPLLPRDLPKCGDHCQLGSKRGCIVSQVSSLRNCRVPRPSRLFFLEAHDNIDLTWCASACLLLLKSSIDLVRSSGDRLDQVGCVDAWELNAAHSACADDGVSVIRRTGHATRAYVGLTVPKAR
jgi:hypothetical protein